MSRLALLIRLLRCHEAEKCPVRRVRLALVILQLQRVLSV